MRAHISFRLHFRLVLSLLVLAIFGAPGFYTAPSGAQSSRVRYQQDLERVFTRHEDLRLDPRVAARRVREEGRLSLLTSTRGFEIELKKNDLRAPNYRTQETTSAGIVRELEIAAVNTYEGSVIGRPDTEARFTIDEQTIEGMIITPEDTFFVESARKYSAAAETTDYLLYKASDVQPNINKWCGVTLDQEISFQAKGLAPSASSISPEVFSPFKIVEIATEADFEYVTALGGSSAANNDILSTLNQIEGIYERDIGLTFTVTFQNAWATASDPYNTSGSPLAMINEFRDVWNRDFPTTPRDVAHLWTGRSLGGPAGVAFTAVVCSVPSHSYGLSDRDTLTVFKVGIPAHEIGHNFSASHSDGQAACDNTIMGSTATQSTNLNFCQFSINEITNYVNLNSSCLTNASGNPIDTPDFFVRQHYLDFLNRTADAAGLAFWTGEITSCGTDQACISNKRVNVSAAFFLSIEFQQTGYLVERIYKTAYGDATGTSTFGGTHQLAVPVVRFSEFLPDTQQIGQGVVVGQSGWEVILENNKRAYTAAFVQRTRFTDAYPLTMPPALFVQTLNQNAGSPLSPAELATLTTEHTTGAKPRQDVLRQIAEHSNLNNAEFNRAFVLMQYFGYLRRNPNDPPDSDYTGYDFWLSKLNQFNGNFVNADMVKAFITSSEYRQRFGTP